VNYDVIKNELPLKAVKKRTMRTKKTQPHKPIDMGDMSNMKTIFADMFGQ